MTFSGIIPKQSKEDAKETVEEDVISNANKRMFRMHIGEVIIVSWDL